MLLNSCNPCLYFPVAVLNTRIIGRKQFTLDYNSKGLDMQINMKLTGHVSDNIGSRVSELEMEQAKDS